MIGMVDSGDGGGDDGCVDGDDDDADDDADDDDDDDDDFNNNEARERSVPFFPWFSKEKKPLHNGSHEHRVPKIINQTLFCTRDVCLCDSTS